MLDNKKRDFLRKKGIRIISINEADENSVDGDNISVKLTLSFNAKSLSNKYVKVSSNKSDYIEELKKLKELYDQGIITKEEFEQEKKEILNNNHK